MQEDGFLWPQLADVLASSGLMLYGLHTDGNLRISRLVLEYDGADANNIAISVTLSPDLWSGGSQAHRDQILHTAHYLGPSLARFAQQGPFRLHLDVDDAGSSGSICMDRPLGSDWLLIPDKYLLDTAQYTPRPMSEAAFRAEFVSRKPIVFWRGGTTGGAASSPEQLMLNRRVAACRAIGRTEPNRTDCKISRVVQINGSFTHPEACQLLSRHGLLAEEVDEETFAGYQMTLDLPGNVAAWGTCRKYLSGCLILRPDQHRELVYTRLLAPWIHYLPLAPDLNDLRERLDWVDAHRSEAATIAWNGREQLVSILGQVPTMLRDAFQAGNESTLGLASEATNREIRLDA